MINKVTLVGRLGAEPEIRTLENGAVVARFSLATSENYRDRTGEWREQTEWHDVVVWRQLAERAQQYLKKGSLVYLEGKLSHRKWQDKEGNNRKTTEVVGSYYRIMPTAPRGEQNPAYGSGQPQQPPAPGPSPAPASAPQTAATTPPPADDGEDLPF